MPDQVRHGQQLQTWVMATPKIATNGVVADENNPAERRSRVVVE
jgi:hypothetical protein